MKRLAFTLSLALAASMALAQAPFTIVRPADGSRVRETVRLLIPKRSVPQGGYIGIFLGGKFIEATIPPDDSTHKYYEYDLDTKKMQIPDGKLTLEAVLYVDYTTGPRIVDRTSVEVTVANTAPDKVPDDGLTLRYKWVPGTQWIYDLTLREINDISDSKENALGAKPVETENTVDKLRVMYAVDNAYSDGSGLVRTQALPDKGSDSVFVKSHDHRYYGNEMEPIYQRLSSTGLEIWGSFPPLAIPLEGTSGSGGGVTDLVADIVLPTLPAKKIKIGQPWSSRFQGARLPEDADRLYTNSLVEHFPARGEFKGVEWELGHPCAKIVNSIGEMEESVEAQKLAKQGRAFTGNKVQLEETIWFALDRRQIVKVVRRITMDAQVSTSSLLGLGGGAGASGQAGPAGAPMGAGAPGGAPGTGPGAGGGKERDNTASPFTQSELQRPAGGRMTPGGASPGGFGPGGPGRGGFGRPGSGPGGPPSTTTFIRETIEITMVLES